MQQYNNFALFFVVDKLASLAIKKCYVFIYRATNILLCKLMKKYWVFESLSRTLSLTLNLDQYPDIRP